LEINFKNNVEYNINPRDIYSKSGFKLLEQNCHMQLNLATEDSVDGRISDEYDIIPIDKANFEELLRCFKTTFRQSEDRWLLDRSDEELEDYFENTVIKSPFQLINDASIAIKHDKQIITFSIVRESHGQANGHLWIMGVHPNYRNQGIGFTLVNHVKKQLIKNDFKTCSLNVDITNIPAIRLYEKHGFREDWVQTNYTWNRNK